MSVISIERPKNISVDTEILKDVLVKILEDYTNFDIELMKQYIDTKDIPEKEFINI